MLALLVISDEVLACQFTGKLTILNVSRHCLVHRILGRAGPFANVDETMQVPV